MAKGESFLKGVVKKAKGFGGEIASNLKVDGGINGVARSVAGKEGHAIKQAMQASGREMGKTGAYSKAGIEAAQEMKKGVNVFYNTHTTKGLYNSYKNTSGIRSGGIMNNAAVKTVGGMTKEYFWDGANTAQRATRIGAVAGAYAGANAIGRFASGGTMTRNGEGKRDIAGIPFV